MAQRLRRRRRTWRGLSLSLLCGSAAGTDLLVRVVLRPIPDLVLALALALALALILTLIAVLIPALVLVLVLVPALVLD